MQQPESRQPGSIALAFSLEGRSLYLPHSPVTAEIIPVACVPSAPVAQLLLKTLNLIAETISPYYFVRITSLILKIKYAMQLLNVFCQLIT